MQLRSSKNDHESALNTNANCDPSLPCSICGLDLINEPCSIRCDGNSCKRLFHPSCLGTTAPLDSELWFCHHCQPTESIHDFIDTNGKVDRFIKQARERFDLNNCEDNVPFCCPKCETPVLDEDDGLLCDSCELWNHRSCLNISEAEYLRLNDSDDTYLCPACYLKSSNESIQVTLPEFNPDTNINEAKWGVLIGDQILSAVKLAYEEIVQWKRNLFKLPTGSAGRDFLEEMTVVLNMFNSSSALKSAAVTMVMIMPPLLLQNHQETLKLKTTKYILKSA